MGFTCITIHFRKYQTPLKPKPTKDSMIKQINILLEALPESEVKDIYEHLTGADKEAIEMKTKRWTESSNQICIHDNYAGYGRRRSKFKK